MIKEQAIRFLVVTAIVLAYPVVAMSATIHIPADQPTIQAGIDSAKSGDTVLVAAGTYMENISFRGKSLSLRSSSGPGNTIIDGNQAGSVVTIGFPAGTDTVLEGFTVKNGLSMYGGGLSLNAASPLVINNVFADNNALEGGGGIRCNAWSSPTIQNNGFIGNSSGIAGAGILCQEHSSPLILGNSFFENHTGWSGGGINCWESDFPQIIQNIFHGNTAGKRGGGARFSFCSGTMAGNLFLENSAHVGGGICCSNSDTSIITNNIIAGNKVTLDGGGISCGTSSTTLITNNTLFNNSALNSGGGISSYYNADTVVTNSVLWENHAAVGPEIRNWTTANPSSLLISHSLLKNGQASIHVDPGCTLIWGPGMIDADPLFVDPASCDFHLTWDSPCIDTGDNSAPEITDHDFEEDPRIAYGTVDMGADEFYRHLYYMGNATPGSSIELKFIDLPGSSPVGLYYCVSGVLDPPMPGAYGDWYLMPPVFGTGPIGTIPSNGVMVLPIALPPSLPAPFDLYMQAIMGTPLKLTNLCTMSVEQR